MSNELADELEQALKGVTPTRWEVYEQPVANLEEAQAELAKLAAGTPFYGETLYMLTAPTDMGFLAPAVTGIGKNSAANARFIAFMRNNADAILAALRAAPEPVNLEGPIEGHPPASILGNAPDLAAVREGNFQLTCGCKSRFMGFPAQWAGETRDCQPCTVYGQLCEQHFYEYEAEAAQYLPASSAKRGDE